MAKFALTRNGRPSRPRSLDTPRVSISWFFSNSSISGEKVSNGRPRRCSRAAPVSWSAKASVLSSRLATRSRRTCRSSRRLGASIAPVTIGRTYYIPGLTFQPRLGAVRRIAGKLPEYAALDLETTGLDPARDRVIEIGAVAFTSDQVTSTLEQLVDPGRAVPDTVLRLTGIKQEELRGAATPESALRRLADFLRGRQPVGHGARLDVEFLEAAGLWDESQEILDTLDIARILLPGAGSHLRPRRIAGPKGAARRSTAWLRASGAAASDAARGRPDPGARGHAGGRGRDGDRQEPRLPRAVDRAGCTSPGACRRLDQHAHAPRAADVQRSARAARMAAMGLQGMPAQRPVELCVAAPLAALPQRAMQGRRGADVQAQGPHLAATHREPRSLGASPAWARGGAVEPDRQRPTRLRRHPLYEGGLLRPPRACGGRDR